MKIFFVVFAPNLYEEIDFTKAPDFLQQELFKEIMKGKKGTNYADQIVKVHLKGGEEQWILVHIEVQGSEEDDFPKRMLKYFCRVFDRFNREIVAFAVMTGQEKKTAAHGFTYSYFGTKLNYAYNVRKITDYGEEAFVQFDRLFSKIVLAAKYLHETKKDADMRYKFKTRLMHEMIKMDNDPRKSIQAVFYFIDYLLYLLEDLTKHSLKRIGQLYERSIYSEANCN